MKHTLQLRLAPAVAGEEDALRAEVARQIGCAPGDIAHIDLRRRSIDARRRPVMVNLGLDVYVGEYPGPDAASTARIEYPDVSSARPVTVVGAGPAGLFAALELIELGLKPIVLERGKDVDSRRRDQADLCRTGIVDPDSNYCFGEGGAGAYSDGKLYTRSVKRGPVDKVLRIFHDHGADDSVLIDAHPHIGTDRLPVIIKAMRETIIAAGGEVHFGMRVTGLRLDGNRLDGVVTADGHMYPAPVILATGHSARDTYRMLCESGVLLEPKGIAVGVRLEHPQQLIDRIQYHSPEGRGRYLPPAEYSMLTRVGDRAVYSFCMCPGGVIVPAASAPGEMVVNGMSPSNRGTRWANSGMVVEILTEDVPGDSPLRMLDYQAAIEQRFYQAAGSTLVAPAQRMTDFVASCVSRDLPRSSYAPGVQPLPIHQLLPAPVATRLQQGFRQFGRTAHGFLTHEAILVGDETRTSAPVRIPRDRETLTHVSVSGLYPCGEGAGYAGGIVSAAIDGINTAHAIAKIIKN